MDVDLLKIYPFVEIKISWAQPNPKVPSRSKAIMRSLWIQRKQ